MANQNSSETENTSVVAKENSNADSAALSVNKDVKIDKEVAQKVHEKVMNETNKSIDSLAKTSQIIPEVIDETPPEAEDKKVVKNPVKPQIIKETKIIYKEKPTARSIAVNPIQKYGNLSFSVEDNAAAISEVRYLVKKYDGKIKSENLTSNNENNTNYIVAKIPLKEYDYLIEDLMDNLGTLNDKTLEITGDDYQPKKLCDVEITLYSKNNSLAKNEDEPKTFGGKAVNALTTGWEVIGNVLLFFLPFWPLFLLITFGYFYFKKKKTKENLE
jgi:DNA-directed RNA polymerase subunit F